LKASYKRDDISKINTLRKEAGNLIIDLRPYGTYAAIHIQGTTNVPYQYLTSEIGRLARSKNTPIYLFCSTGDNSYEAALRLESMGYTNVTDLGAIAGWRYGYK
jgi:rhodanese-related sulfurtransferase